MGGGLGYGYTEKDKRMDLFSKVLLHAVNPLCTQQTLTMTITLQKGHRRMEIHGMMIRKSMVISNNG